mmetsp:Transcript_45275/g.70989  ORF Transcript_45275/g.70989 Transcript_45275/m.70989 type:complete len:214 (+) Transcript_45275:872-1513(+)
MPLMWSWYGDLYIGAAHGVVGILRILMRLSSTVESLGSSAQVKGCAKALLNLQTTSGNFPVVLDENEDDLVHWCHGSPGAISALLQAHALYNDEAYLHAAQRAGELVFSRGLLRKGFGICHGVGGNGLALLSLYRSTGSDRHLGRAQRFGMFACRPNCEHHTAVKTGLRKQPDARYSLFEGMAGLACFLASLLELPTCSGIERTAGLACPWIT